MSGGTLALTLLGIGLAVIGIAVTYHYRPRDGKRGADRERATALHMGIYWSGMAFAGDDGKMTSVGGQSLTIQNKHPLATFEAVEVFGGSNLLKRFPSIEPGGIRTAGVQGVADVTVTFRDPDGHRWRRSRIESDFVLESIKG